jgi:hypothetical protein
MLMHLLHNKGGKQTRLGESHVCGREVHANESFLVCQKLHQLGSFLSEIKLANWRAQRVIEHIEQIVNLCVQRDSQVRWNDTFELYCQMIKICMC